MEMPPDDRELLEHIRSLYELDRTAWWSKALSVMVRMARSQGGLVAVADGPSGEFRTRARVGDGADVLAEVPAEPGVRMVARSTLIRVRHSVFPYDTLWVSFECAVDPQRWAWLTGLPTHLKLATDFTIRQGDGGPLPDRLRDADPERRRLVESALVAMGDRASACALLAARGYANHQIADYLALNPATVARALKLAYRHFGVPGRSSLDVAVLLALPKPPPAEAPV